MASYEERVNEARLRFDKVIDEIIDDRARLMIRLERAESIIENYGFVAGMLDVCGGDISSLLKLVHDARDRLRDAADKYWSILKDDEEPVKFRDKEVGRIKVLNERDGDV